MVVANVTLPSEMSVYLAPKIKVPWENWARKVIYNFTLRTIYVRKNWVEVTKQMAVLIETDHKVSIRELFKLLSFLAKSRCFSDGCQRDATPLLLVGVVRGDLGLILL